MTAIDGDFYSHQPIICAACAATGKVTTATIAAAAIRAARRWTTVICLLRIWGGAPCSMRRHYAPRRRRAVTRVTGLGKAPFGDFHMSKAPGVACERRQFLSGPDGVMMIAVRI